MLNQLIPEKFKNKKKNKNNCTSHNINKIPYQDSIYGHIKGGKGQAIQGLRRYMFIMKYRTLDTGLRDTHFSNKGTFDVIGRKNVAEICQAWPKGERRYHVPRNCYSKNAYTLSW